MEGVEKKTRKYLGCGRIIGWKSECGLWEKEKPGCKRRKQGKGISCAGGGENKEKSSLWENHRLEKCVCGLLEKEKNRL